MSRGVITPIKMILARTDKHNICINCLAVGSACFLSAHVRSVSAVFVPRCTFQVCNPVISESVVTDLCLLGRDIVHSGRSLPSFYLYLLLMKNASTPETSAHFCQTTRRGTPYNANLYAHPIWPAASEPSWSFRAVPGHCDCSVKRNCIVIVIRGLP